MPTSLHQTIFSTKSLYKMCATIIGLSTLCIRIMYCQTILHQPNDCVNKSAELFNANLQFLNANANILINSQSNSMHLEYCFPNNTWIGIVTMDQLISKTQIECGKYFLNNCASTNTYSKCIEACLNQQTYKDWNSLSRLDSKWSHKIESDCIDDNKNSIQINFDFDENDALCFLYLDNYHKNII
eukprot:176995_1